MTLRTGAPDSLLSGWADYRCLVSSWDGGRMLAADIPVLAGETSEDVTRTVARSGRVTVPRFSVVPVDEVHEDARPRRIRRTARRYRMDWLPGPDDATHPLAADGQELRIAVLVTSPMTGIEYVTQVGRLRIVEAVEAADGAVDVTVEGCAQIAVDAGLTVPTAPRANGTLASEFRRLLPSGLGVTISPDLVDRAVPRSLEWADDRMAALSSIASAWPALLREDDDGGLVLSPDLPAEIAATALTLTDGVGGTVVEAPRTVSRLGVINEWVARGTDEVEGRPPVQAVVRQTSGRYSTTAYGTVTGYYSSPLLTTVAQCEKAAATRLRTGMLPTRTVTVHHAPDPRIGVDVPVRVVRDGTTWRGYVIASRLPLTVADGAQETTIGVVD